MTTIVLHEDESIYIEANGRVFLFEHNKNAPGSIGTWRTDDEDDEECLVAFWGDKNGEIVDHEVLL